MSNPVTGEWYKSSFSDSGKECVEICHDPGVTLVRDTKDAGSGPILTFPADVWTAFIDSGIWAR